MSADTIAHTHANLVSKLTTDTAPLRLKTGPSLPPSRSSTADSFTSAGYSPTSSPSSPPRSSTASSRRPSVSRHQSVSVSPKLGPHPVESFLDLAQASSAADAALLKAALLRAGAKPVRRDATTRPNVADLRRYTAPSTGVEAAGPHTWYTDAANPIVAGLHLRQTVASGSKGLHAHVSQMPGGVQLVHMVLPRCIDAVVATDLEQYGQSRYAAMLKPDLKTNTLLKIKFNGKAHVANDGYYACIIDQNDTLLVSVLSAESQGAPAGAHAHLAGGLPVRFAGELRIAGGRVVWLNNASGHYRTPGYLVSQALTQPLLVDAQIDIIGL